MNQHWTKVPTTPSEGRWLLVSLFAICILVIRVTLQVAA
jgi:hypothetical protein